MVKGLGRIILMVVGGLMLASGIYFMIHLGINSLSDFIGAIKENPQQFGLQLVMILSGASAVLAGLFGKGGFWFTIFALGNLALLIWQGVTTFKGQSFEWETLGQFIIDSALSIAYVVGFLFLKKSSD